MTYAQTPNVETPTENVESQMRDVTRIVKQSGSSFYGAMRILEPGRRDALYGIYAFCRAVDDIADDMGDPAIKTRELDNWRQEIDRVYQGAAETSVGKVLATVVKRYGLDKQDFAAVIDGMELDARDRVRMADMHALFQYIDHVACAVGRLCTPVFGIPDEPGKSLAKTLGEALQITNILRDLEEDAARNRIYLPLDRLNLLGLDGEEVSEIYNNPACIPLLDELAEIARKRCGEAEFLLSQVDRKTRRAPRLMLFAYRILLQKVVEYGWRMPRQRAVLSPFEKFWTVIRYGWF